MSYIDLGYRDYFHKFIVFEVDNLTDDVKDKVNVSQEDCFMLGYSFISNSGELMFSILSVGDSFDNCTKGLDIESELAVYSGEFMSFFNCQKIVPNMKMINKAYNISEKLEVIDDELKEILDEESLDFVRNPFYPGNLLVKQNLNNFNIKITKIGDYVIDGVIEENSFKGIVKAISYSSNGEKRLITIIADSSASDVEIKMIESFLTELSKGISKHNSDVGMKS